MESNIRANNWLGDFRKITTSQRGEDGVIEKIFEVIGVENKWCVEFGAGSGKKGNNTWSLIKEKNWSGVLIEAESALYTDLRKRYEDRGDVVCINAIVEESGKNSLDNLLSKTDIPEQFDFVSIDIDGYDYHVWKSLQKYSPRVVMIEINPNIPIELSFVQPDDIKACGGSSLLATTDLAREKGYELVYTYGVNAIFVKKELFGRFGITDNSPIAMFTEPRSTYGFFQFYDGSIVLLGVERNKVLAYRKKIKQAPVWVYENGRLYPVKFTHDRKIIRLIKNFFKKTSLYSLFYPLIKRIYGGADFKRKKKISQD